MDVFGRAHGTKGEYIINNQLYYDLARQLKAIYENVDVYNGIYRQERKKAENDIRLFGENKMKAIQGLRSSRDYIINQFVIMLSQKVVSFSEKDFSEMIDFENILKNDVQILFEMLLFLFDFSELLNRYITGLWNQSGEQLYGVTEEHIRKIAAMEEEALQTRFENRIEKLKFLSTMIYAKEYGQDIIDTLQYHNINEIGFLGKDYVYIIYRGNKIHLEFLRFQNDGILVSIMKKSTSNAKPSFDEQNPCIVASKSSGSRITVAGYDATPAEDEWYYNERIFNLVKITLEDMRDRYRTIDDRIYQLLCLNQQGRGSFFVTGADMGVGKSTFLLAMMEKLPANWGIGILDTQNELQARKKFPWMNIITLIQNTKLGFDQLFAIMLKMARDVLIVGEITLPQEVSELIKAALRLNAGVGGTLHSISPFEVITNLRNLMMLTPMYSNAETAEADIARGLDLVIHLARHPLENGRIIVESIVEVQYTEPSSMEDIQSQGTLKQKMERLAVLAQKGLQKYLFRKCYRYSEIVRYDYEKETWVTVNVPSQAYLNKLARYVKAEHLQKFYRNTE